MNRENDRRKMRSLYDWIDEARHAGGFANVARAVEARLENEPDNEVRRSLNFELAGAYKMAGRFDEAERIYMMLFNQSPDEPMPLISLAGQKLYFEEDPATAMEVIERMEKARRQV